MVSVCMATYNGEKYIKEQIDSILVQLDDGDELIISDDGSTDNTISIIKSYIDPRIKLYISNSHCYTTNFENALSKAKGDYIFLSDQDDIWLKGKVETCLKYLRDYDFVVSNAIIVNQKLEHLVESRNDLFKVKTGFLNNFVKTYYLGCCMAFSRKVLDLALPFPKNHKLCLHDAWIGLISEYNFRTFIIEKPLILYRRHDNNTSNGMIKKEWKIIKSIRIRIYILFNIMKRSFLNTKS